MQLCQGDAHMIRLIKEAQHECNLLFVLCRVLCTKKLQTSLPMSEAGWVTLEEGSSSSP